MQIHFFKSTCCLLSHPQTHHSHRISESLLRHCWSIPLLFLIQTAYQTRIFRLGCCRRRSHKTMSNWIQKQTWAGEMLRRKWFLSFYLPKRFALFTLKFKLNHSSLFIKSRRSVWIIIKDPLACFNLFSLATLCDSKWLNTARRFHLQMNTKQFSLWITFLHLGRLNTFASHA